MPDALHVTFVCTGNICRSPMAEKIFADASRARGPRRQGPRHQRRHRRLARRQSGRRACRRGTAPPRLPIDHTAAQVGPDHLDADLVVALDTGHDRALAHAGVPTDRRRLLRSFDPLADGPDVADPYYGGPDGFASVREQIEAAVPGLLAWVRSTLSPRPAR